MREAWTTFWRTTARLFNTTDHLLAAAEKQAIRLDEFSERVERDLLADQFRKASERCRRESIEVCREFEALEEQSEYT